MEGLGHSFKNLRVFTTDRVGTGNEGEEHWHCDTSEKGKAMTVVSLYFPAHCIIQYENLWLKMINIPKELDFINARDPQPPILNELMQNTKI